MSSKRNNVETLNNTQRVTISFLPKAQRDIEYLVEEMGMTKADIVNIAVSNFAFMQRRSKAGKEWIARDKKTHEGELIRFPWELDDEGDG